MATKVSVTGVFSFAVGALNCCVSLKFIALNIVLLLGGLAKLRTGHRLRRFVVRGEKNKNANELNELKERESQCFILNACPDWFHQGLVNWCPAITFTLHWLGILAFPRSPLSSNIFWVPPRGAKKRKPIVNYCRL